MRVVGGELEIPFELSRIRIEGDYRAGIKIIAVTSLCVHIRPRIPRRPVNQIQLGIKGAGHPSRAPGVFRREIAPGFGTRLTSSGNCPEAPEFFSGCSGQCGDKPARPAVASTHSHNDAVFQSQRGKRRDITFAGQGILLVPKHGTGIAMERDQMDVTGQEEDPVTQ